jgi:hypothetical protein
MGIVQGLGMVLATILCAGCVIVVNSPGKAGSGNARTETRDVPAFSKVRIENSGTTDVTIGPPGPLTITADDNLLEYITTEVRGDTLVLDCRDSCRPRTPIRVTVSTPSLTGAAIAGAGTISVRGLDESKFDASISGSGKIVAEGSAERLVASISGSGSLELAKLAAQQADVRISGSGNADIQAAQELTTAISGSGAVTYHGRPEKLETRVSGSGKVLSQ